MLTTRLRIKYLRTKRRIVLTCFGAEADDDETESRNRTKFAGMSWWWRLLSLILPIRFIALFSLPCEGWRVLKRTRSSSVSDGNRIGRLMKMASVILVLVSCLRGLLAFLQQQLGFVRAIQNSESENTPSPAVVSVRRTHSLRDLFVHHVHGINDPAVHQMSPTNSIPSDNAIMMNPRAKMSYV